MRNAKPTEKSCKIIEVRKATFDSALKEAKKVASKEGLRVVQISEMPTLK